MNPTIKKVIKAIDEYTEVYQIIGRNYISLHKNDKYLGTLFVASLLESK